jgi:hypothetical protein
LLWYFEKIDFIGLGLFLSCFISLLFFGKVVVIFAFLSYSIYECMKNKTISSQTPKGNERRCNELVGPGEGTKRVAGSLKDKRDLKRKHGDS